MTAWSPRTASIATDRGRIDVPEPFHHPTTVTWTPLAATPDPPERLRRPATITEGELIGTGLAHEALEVVAAAQRRRRRVRWSPSMTPWR